MHITARNFAKVKEKIKQKKKHYRHHEQLPTYEIITIRCMQLIYILDIFEIL